MKIDLSLAGRHSMINAHKDFVGGVLYWKIWFSLGVHDIRLRYKRTILGPLWVVIGTTATFVLMSMLFSAVLKNDIRTFLPYVGAGMITWGFFSATIQESPNIFIASHHIIDSLKMPLTVHVLRCVFKNMVIYLHNIFAYIIVCVFIGNPPGPYIFLIFAFLPILFLAVFFVSLLLSIVGARFRDVAQMIGIALQLFFFMTPIMWQVSDIPGGRKYWVFGNPIYHLIEIIREPLQGRIPAMTSIVVSMVSIVVVGLLSYVLFLLFRRRISYWL